MNSYGAEWRNDISLGNTVAWVSSFYQPLSERQYFFVEPRILYSNTPFDVYVDNQKVAELRDQVYGAGIDFGANFVEYGDARIGYYYGRRKFTLESGPLFVPPDEGIKVGLLRAGLPHRSARQRELHPLRLLPVGLDGGLGLRARRQRELRQVRAAGTNRLSFGRHSLQFVCARWRLDRRQRDTRLCEFPARWLPQHVRLCAGAAARAALHLRSRSATRRGCARFRCSKAFTPGWRSRRRGCRSSSQQNPKSSYMTGTVYGAVDTPLGVLYLGYGYSDPDNSSIYLYLGKPF